MSDSQKISALAEKDELPDRLMVYALAVESGVQFTSAAVVREAAARIETLNEECEKSMEEIENLRAEKLALRNEVEALNARCTELEVENKQAWRERNEAVTMVKTWEAIVCLVEPFPPLIAVKIKEWGEGDGDVIGVQLPSPEKLTDILDEVARYRDDENPPKHQRPA